MMQGNQFCTNGGKKLSEVRSRVTQSQMERMKFLAEQSGHKTLSSYIRECALSNDLHYKLNLILDWIKTQNRIK